MTPRRPYQLPQRSHQLVDPVLKKILVGVLSDDGSIEEGLVSALLMSILDVVSQSLDDIDALSLPAFKKYLLKAFKGYVWWYQIYNGRLPPFASMTREKFDSFLCSHHWDPMSLFGVYIDEPEEPQLQDIPLQDFEISAPQEPFFLQWILHHGLCDRGTLQESLTYHCIHSLGDLLCMPLPEIEEMTMLPGYVRTRSQLTSKAKLSS